MALYVEERAKSPWMTLSCINGLNSNDVYYKNFKSLNIELDDF